MQHNYVGAEEMCTGNEFQQERIMRKQAEGREERETTTQKIKN